MSENFKALVLSQDGENFNREVKSIDKGFLKHGDVTVKVHYSGLNYKLRQQYFTGLGETSGIDGLKINQKFGFPRSPDSSLLLESFIAKPVNKAEDYAIAIEGYISPKDSGEYQFLINYKGSSELRLSMGNNPVSGFNKIGATGDDIVGESESPFIYLDSSNYYYLRGLVRYNTNDDIFSVSMKKKGETEYVNINSENLYTGLRVLPLEQDMIAGDKVYFNKHLSFKFTSWGRDCSSGRRALQIYELEWPRSY